MRPSGGNAAVARVLPVVPSAKKPTSASGLPIPLDDPRPAVPQRATCHAAVQKGRAYSRSEYRLPFGRRHVLQADITWIGRCLDGRRWPHRGFDAGHAIKLIAVHGHRNQRSGARARDSTVMVTDPPSDDKNRPTNGRSAWPLRRTTAVRPSGLPVPGARCQSSRLGGLGRSAR